ncbi:MAG TPA: type II toxin-antitoxin system Phd/YefM family antitoxin [Thermoanaerobaculia bacterium]|nr:type II toxin-antitoxin system Phd/YefM family antitoxin [Thermoanaerobaculia bacterium]
MDTTYTHARAHFASLCDHAVSTLEPVVIHRRGAEDVALVSASELRSLELTLHELRSPRNAARLLSALARAMSRETEPQAVESLREEFDLEKAK